MSYGLEIYDSSGNVTLTITDRTVRYVSFHTGTIAAGSTDTISISGLTNDGTWGFNSEGGEAAFIKTAFGATGSLELENIDSTLSRTYYIQVFRV